VAVLGVVLVRDIGIISASWKTSVLYGPLRWNFGGHISEDDSVLMSYIIKYLN